MQTFGPRAMVLAQVKAVGLVVVIDHNQSPIFYRVKPDQCAS